jgi:predicted lipoprotein
MKRVVVIAVLVAAAAVVVWRYPLFHIVRIDEAASESRWGAIQPSFNARQFAELFWTERLMQSLGTALNVEVFQSVYSENPQQVRKHHGRSVGVSRQTLYVLQGAGHIVSVDKKGVGVAIGDDGDEVDVLLQTGPVFGNAARDCSGLLRPGDFPNSQQYNELSAELNRIVELRVIAPLAKHAAVGDQILFVGCAELANNVTEVKPLPLVPLRIQFDKPLEAFER